MRPQDRPDNAKPDSAAAEAAPRADASLAADTAGPSPKFPVVAIGASAGGLEALDALAQRLTPAGVAYVVQQHLAPGHSSLLPEILARSTALRVEAIAEGRALEPDTVLGAPPGVDVAVHNGALRLTPAVEHGARHPIDALFRSLAAECGPGAIGVVLSGAGTDGTLGLRAIKDQGGITFAQEPSTAAHPSMPQSAM